MKNEPAQNYHQKQYSNPTLMRGQIMHSWSGRSTILSFKVKYIMNKWKNFNPIFSTTLRGLDSHGHFYTIFTSFCRRALNNDIDKCSTLKCKIIGFLHYYIVYVNSRPKLSYVKSKANLLMANLLTNKTFLCICILWFL